MKLKMLLSVVYNIGIFICLYIVYWGYSHQQYAFLLGALFIAVMFVILKIRLLKQVRSMENTVKK
jgi:hypothetical protein